jgi:hypothetical protein
MPLREKVLLAVLAAAVAVGAASLASPDDDVHPAPPTFHREVVQ